MQPIRGAPISERLSYRSKTWMRSFFTSEELSFGMYRAVQKETKWSKEFVSWNTCPLPLPAISETLKQLRKILFDTLPSHSRESLFGVWVGTPNLVIVAREDFSDLLDGVEWEKVLRSPLVRVFFHQTSQVGKKVFGSAPIRLIYGPPIGVHHPIRAFRQVAQSLLVEARNLASESLLESKPEIVVDLYCGTGELSTFFPASVGWLGVEISRPAVDYANTLKPGERICHSAYIGLVQDRLKDPKFNEKVRGHIAVYINPPRTGLTREGVSEVNRFLRRNNPNTVAYLSCSASSLARDLRQLTIDNEYRVRSLQPFDFFPQTEHFETLAILERLR